MEIRPWCETCKCIIHAMGKTLFLCFSTFQPDDNLSAENRAGPSYGSNPSPLWADTTLVYNTPSPINKQSSVPASAEPSLNITSQQRSTPSSQAVKVDGLQGLWKSLQQRNISEKAVTISHSQMGQRNNINCTSCSGLTFVVSERLIPTIHL